MNEEGNFEVKAGSEVLIVSEVINMNQNLAAFPKKTACNNGNGQVVTVTSQGLKKTGSFKAPAGVGTNCSVGLVFEFKPDATGDFGQARYKVTLIERHADGSEDKFEDDTVWGPPPPTGGTYTFVIS